MSGKNKKVDAVEGTAKRGRPQFKAKFPMGVFTFLSLCVLNKVTDATGKELPKNERNCSKLTIRNVIDRETWNPNGAIARLENEFGTPLGEKGIGRKPYKMIRRELLADHLARKAEKEAIAAAKLAEKEAKEAEKAAKLASKEANKAPVVDVTPKPKRVKKPKTVNAEITTPPVEAPITETPSTEPALA
jgi:hypothetical protein